MPSYLVFFIFSCLFIFQYLYFKIANRFNIIDRPNHRSSHTSITIRGGGVIFTFAALIFFFLHDFQYICFILGLLLISVVSFLDDVMTLNNKIRLSAHLIAVLLLFYQWDLYGFEWYWLLIAGIFIIGTVNAYNFMDGINGITGSYSLLVILTLYYINDQVIAFTSADFMLSIALALLVFNFYNFRKKAKCFAGDVGSVSIAFIIVFLIGQLILKAHNFSYILLLLCYGLDTAFTVAFRIIRKENVFEAHRRHFYQFLANEKKIPHLLVSIFYFLAQLTINVLIIFVVKESILLMALLFLFSSILIMFIRFLMEGKQRLLGSL